MVKNFSLSSGNNYTKNIKKKKFISILKKDQNDLQKVVEKIS